MCSTVPSRRELFSRERQYRGFRSVSALGLTLYALLVACNGPGMQATGDGTSGDGIAAIDATRADLVTVDVRALDGGEAPIDVAMPDDRVDVVVPADTRSDGSLDASVRDTRVADVMSLSEVGEADAVASRACHVRVGIDWTDVMGSAQCFYLSGPDDIGSDYSLGNTADLVVDAAGNATLTFDASDVFVGTLASDGTVTLLRVGMCGSAPFSTTFHEQIFATIGSDCSLTARYRYRDCTAMTGQSSCDPTPPPCDSAGQCVTGTCMNGECIDPNDGDCQLTADMQVGAPPDADAGTVPDSGTTPVPSGLCMQWCTHLDDVASTFSTPCPPPPGFDCMASCMDDLGVNPDCNSQGLAFYQCATALAASNFYCLFSGSTGNVVMNPSTACDSSMFLFQVCQFPSPQGDCTLAPPG